MESKLEPERQQADVGIIVARFQTHELHPGHKDIIFTALQNHARVIIFLGVSPTRCTLQNPLDFSSRKQMIAEAYPNIDVLYIKDVPCDLAWSKNLDAQISSLIGPQQSAMLYGSRESFIAHYTGKYPTTSLRQDKYISASQVRQQIAKSTKNSPDFRAGAIWSAYNRWPMLIPTVDVAIFDEDYANILLGRKPHQTKFQFIGGFAQPIPGIPNESIIEMNAIKEVAEETGLEVSDPQFIGTAIIDDWRYNGELDKIATTFFHVKRVFGHPVPKDDIEELQWFGVHADRTADCITDSHQVLFKMLKEKVCG